LPTPLNNHAVSPMATTKSRRPLLLRSASPRNRRPRNVSVTRRTHDGRSSLFGLVCCVAPTGLFVRAQAADCALQYLHTPLPTTSCVFRLYPRSRAFVDFGPVYERCGLLPNSVCQLTSHAPVEPRRD
jgi:hypothetical protein